MRNICILVCYHNDSYILRSDAFMPLQVGRALSDKKLDMKGDDERSNISHLNKTFCELTAIYWAWKNIDANYYGLCHYRRFFNFKNNQIFFSKFSDDVSEKFGWKDISRYIDSYDIILPEKFMLFDTLKNHYEKNHHIQDLNITLDIIDDLFPDYSLPAQEVLKQDSAHMYNMFIMKKDIFLDYSSWLFTILFALEKRLYIANYDDYQKRVFGFIAERLLNIYITKNKDFKIKTYPILMFTKMGLKHKILNFKFVRDLQYIFKSNSFTASIYRFCMKK